MKGFGGEDGGGGGVESNKMNLQALRANCTKVITSKVVKVH